MWLTAVVMEVGKWHDTTLGSPQGGVISPLLANLYLHYLDTLWVKQYAHVGTIVRIRTIWWFFAGTKHKRWKRYK